MRRTLGWANVMSMHHDWFHSSIVITLVHLITFMWFTLLAWTSMPVYQHHDFAAVRLMHPWRGGDVRGTPKFQSNSNIPTLRLMRHFAIPVTLCDRPPKKSHQVATPIDHPVRVAYCLPLPCHSPFYFCALLLPSYSTSISFHTLFPILSIFHILPVRATSQSTTTLRFLQGGSKEKTLRTPQVKGDYIRNRVHSNQQRIT